MPTPFLIFRISFLALVLASAAWGARADQWPADSRIKIALEPGEPVVSAQGEMAVGVSIWVGAGAPLTIRGVAATIGEGAEIVRRTNFMGFDLIYGVDEVEAAPGGWTRLTGDQGGVIISGVREQDLAKGGYLLFLDCGEAGVRALSVPLADRRRAADVVTR